MPLENHLNGFPMILERCSPKLKLGENEKGPELSLKVVYEGIKVAYS